MILYAVFLPILFALLCFIFKRGARGFALISALLEVYFSFALFLQGQLADPFLGLRVNGLGAAIFLMAAVITLLIIIYSFGFWEKKEREGEYYAYILITLSATAGTLLAADYLMLLVFWGIMGAMLYLLIGLGEEGSPAAAKKSMIMVGGADALMILGIGIMWKLTGSFMIGGLPISLQGWLPILAFLTLCAGAFAKAGAVPLHSWIPDAAESAPVTVMALLPAALDKLVGIYLLGRICFDVFILEPGSAASVFLLAIGSLTIIVGVLAALVQHDLKKLLSFHAVSQVGYMIIGIGTANPIGVAGGIFHMFNNAIYKTLHFLAAGAVEKKTGTTRLEELGGLSRFMPITFCAALVAALSISGIPPFNGFFSKWMIYQGIIDLGKVNPYWIIWLLAAMFGSALTLASFLKIIHAVFLGQWSGVTHKAREAHWSMWLPMVVLALFCALFGVFAYSAPLAYLVFPRISASSLGGYWNPLLATALLITGLAVGFIFYLIGNLGSLTPRPPYLGGELIEEKEVKVSGVDFYNTIRDWGPLRAIFERAEQGAFDLYQLGLNLIFTLSGWLSWLHNGRLHTYLAWIFLGGIILLAVYMR
jgi:formate hydrogenlyase subunit 3/multisubunit Na+/H+ antiporter MnhD subunit